MLDPENPDVSHHLTNILLDFQLRATTGFYSLPRIVQKFDTDKDGILNYSEFKTLVTRVNQPETRTKFLTF